MELAATAIQARAKATVVRVKVAEAAERVAAMRAVPQAVAAARAVTATTAEVEATAEVSG